MPPSDVHSSAQPAADPARRTLIQEALDTAIEHQRRGDFPVASEIYQHVLGIEPLHTGALHLAGVLAHQIGQSALAVKLIERAVETDTVNAELQNSLGVVLQGAGRVGEAVRAYHNALSRNIAYTEARMNLGTALEALGRSGEARYLYEQSIRERPDYADAYLNLGNVMRRAGQNDAAAAAYRRVMTLRTNDALPLFNLAQLHADLGRTAEAFELFDQALKLRPSWRKAEQGIEGARKMLGRRHPEREAAAAHASYAALNTVLANACRPECSSTGLSRALRDADVAPFSVGDIGPWVDFLREGAVRRAIERDAAPLAEIVDSVFKVACEHLAETGGPFPLELLELVPWWYSVRAAHGVVRELATHAALVASRDKFVLTRERVTTREACLGSAYFETWGEQARDAEMALLLADGVLDGEDIAFANFARRIAQGPVITPPWAHYSNVGRTLGRSGWYDAISDKALQTLHDAFVSRLPTLDRDAFIRLLEVLFYTFDSTRSHGARIYAHIVLPWMLKLYALRRLDEADFLTHWSFNVFGMKLTDEEEYDRFVHSYRQAAAEAGCWLATQFPPTPVVAAQAGPVRVGIINRGGSISTGAFHHILPICQWLSARAPRTLDVVIYVTQYYDEEIEREGARVGCKVVFLSDYGSELNAMLERYVKLRELMARDGIEVAVWAHHPDSMFLLFGMRVAPVQVFYSQYLHPTIKGGDIDAVMTYGSPALVTQPFLDQPWRVITSALEDVSEPPPAIAVEELRARIMGTEFRVLIGTLARTEKICDTRFLSCVARVLKAQPNAMFLWTGHRQDHTVQTFFERAGVAGQTQFVGWVDTVLYARALDVLLDSFPLCNGVTALQAMASGTPVVSLNRNTSFLGRDIVPILETTSEPSIAEAAAVCSEIRRVFEERDAVPAADDEDHYVEIALRLIEQPELRARTGAALQAVSRCLYDNEALMARLFEAHILELAEAAR